MRKGRRIVIMKAVPRMLDLRMRDLEVALAVRPRIAHHAAPHPHHAVPLGLLSHLLGSWRSLILQWDSLTPMGQSPEQYFYRFYHVYSQLTWPL